MKTPSSLYPALAQFALSHGITIDLYDELESTNDTARNPHYGCGDVVVAERQRAGRGQRGNRWESPSGENIMASWVLTPDFLGADRQFYLVKIAALAVSDTLREIGLEAQIKWPNDIYIRGRKVAGILIENDLMGPTIGRSIIGIGLNVNQQLFAPSLPNPTSISLEMEHPETPPDRARLFTALYTHLESRYRALSENNLSDIDTTYWDRLYLRQTPHTFIDCHSQTPFLGSISGVRSSGELEITPLPEGALRSYLFKEVEYTLCEK